MSLTPNFGMNIPDATDIVNLLTQCYPNFTLLDGALQSIKETGITIASETKSGTVHQLVRTDADCNVLRFTATSNFTTGDSFTVDGSPVTGVAVNGTSLQTGDFVINSNVLAIVNGTVLTLFTNGNTSLAASDVTYDNSGSGLIATDVQDALDEVAPALAASGTSYDNSVSGLSASDVQNAIDEIALSIKPDGATITADGVKTIQQLYSELYALIDMSKLNKNSALITTVGGVDYFQNLTIKGAAYAEFARSLPSSALYVYHSHIESSAASCQYGYGACPPGYSYTYSDNSTSVPASGTKYSIIY